MTRIVAVSAVVAGLLAAASLAACSRPASPARERSPGGAGAPADAVAGRWPHVPTPPALFAAVEDARRSGAGVAPAGARVTSLTPATAVDSSAGLAVAAGAPAARGGSTPAIGKPAAPVELTLAVRALGGGVHEVVLEARPGVPAATLELLLRLPPGVTLLEGRARERRAAAPAGVPQRLVARVRTDRGDVRIAGAARLPDAAGRLVARATAVTLGPTGGAAGAAGTPPRRVVRLPWGDGVAEVAP